MSTVTPFDAVRIFSLYEACILAKEHGATCYIVYKVKGETFSVHFLRTRPEKPGRDVSEVATWSPQYMGIYKRLERAFATCFVKDRATGEGFQPIEDIPELF